MYFFTTFIIAWTNLTSSKDPWFLGKVGYACCVSGTVDGVFSLCIKKMALNLVWFLLVRAGCVVHGFYIS